MTTKNELLAMPRGETFTESSHLIEVSEGVDFTHATVYVKVHTDKQTGTPLKPWKGRQFKALLAKATELHALLERIASRASDPFPTSAEDMKVCKVPAPLIEEARAALAILDAITPKGALKP